MLTKFWNGLKKFFSKLTPKNIKDMIMAAMMLFVLIASISTYNSCKQAIRDKERAKVAEENSAATKAANDALYSQNVILLGKNEEFSTANKDLEKANVNLRTERDVIKHDFQDFRNDFRKLSQSGKDKELTQLLKDNGIDVAIVAEGDYMKIVPQEREDLYMFGSKTLECLNLNQNLTREKDNLIKEVANLNGVVVNLNTIITNDGTACTNDKRDLNTKVTVAKNETKTWKKNAFYSKVAGIAGVILSILLLK